MNRKAFLRAVCLTCISALLIPVLAACNRESEGGTDSSAEESVAGETLTVTIGERDYVLRDGINSELTEDGVYIYTAESGKRAFPKKDAADKGFFDIAVLDGTVVAVCDNGSTAVIPENGFVVRFRGVDAPEIKTGDAVKCVHIKTVNYPEYYVKFDDIFIEVGYENLIRTAEDTGWLYNEHWYTGMTESNIYCTEIAILDGKIVEINRSGDDIAGMTIPKGGYVIAVGEGSQNERKTRGLKVGDNAELVRRDALYTSTRFGHSGENRSRPDDGMVIFTREEQTTTPIGNSLTELMVDGDGRITEIHTQSSGMNEIPENGFAVSATGLTAAKLARAATLRAEVLRTGTRTLSIVTTPLTELSRLIAERDAVLEGYESAVSRLDRIDFELVANTLNEMSANISEAEKTLGVTPSESYNGFDGEILASSVTALKALAEQGRRELVPYITVQDRSAWVTLGEYNESKQLVLHYKTQHDVDHTVAYAKLCGLNTLIIDNLVNGFAVYTSEVEGIVTLPQLNGLDLIAAFKQACDEQGLRLIVMVNAFSSGLDKVVYPQDHYMKIYKDKYLLTNKGNHVGSDGVITLDPADKDVQAFNLAVISEIAEKYDVYGVQADYMRYPLPYYYQKHNYEDFGYNESSTAGFIAKYGKDPATLKIDDLLWEKWCEHRRNIISEYQKSFYTTVKAINPELNVSFTCFADYRDRQIYTYQDVEKWAANGYADAIYPMIYGATTEYQLGYAQEIQPITEFTGLILGVGTYVKATHTSLCEQFVMPYDVGSEGVAIFTLRYISTCGYDETVSNAFRVAATPATAEEGTLIAACTEMIVKRIGGLRYAAKFSGALTEPEGEALASLAEKITALGTETAFGTLCSALEEIKADVESGVTVVPEAVKTAVVAELDYVIGLR